MGEERGAGVGSYFSDITTVCVHCVVKYYRIQIEFFYVRLKANNPCRTTWALNLYLLFIF